MGTGTPSEEASTASPPPEFLWSPFNHASGEPAAELTRETVTRDTRNGAFARAPGAELKATRSASPSSSIEGGSSPAPSGVSRMSDLPGFPMRLTLMPDPGPWGSLTEEDDDDMPLNSLLLPLEDPPGLTYGSALNPGPQAVLSNPAPRPLRPGPLDTGASLMASRDPPAPPGITICMIEVAGYLCTRAEWKIEDLRGKLQASMGRPLVSPPFAARGLPNLRLMVFPDAREAVKGVRSRERKGLYAAMVKKGPLHGSLKLKADCLEWNTVLRFFLTMGTYRCGPFNYDFSERAIHGCDDFDTDWLKQVDESTGNLRVGVEILPVK